MFSKQNSKMNRQIKSLVAEGAKTITLRKTGEIVPGTSRESTVKIKKYLNNCKTANERIYESYTFEVFMHEGIYPCASIEIPQLVAMMEEGWELGDDDIEEDGSHQTMPDDDTETASKVTLH